MVAPRHTPLAGRSGGAVATAPPDRAAASAEATPRRSVGAPGASTAPTVDIVRPFPDTAWQDGPTHDVEAVLEAGNVLAFPQLPFPLSDDEGRFLDERWADGSAKNISLRWPGGELRGAAGGADDLAALQRLIARYADAADALALRLFPHYRGHLRRGNTSLRPSDVAGRRASWRQDDTRLHVDAFPSNPMGGTRLLRVFCNVNPHGAPRRWKVGEPFDAHVRRYADQLKPPLPGAAWLLQRLHITKRRRTAYDHLMLRLHDLAKGDARFQAEAPQAAVDFAPGTTWVVFSDQVLHAALGGQHMFEQTFYLEPEHLLQPETAPAAVLQRITGIAGR